MRHLKKGKSLSLLYVPFFDVLVHKPFSETKKKKAFKIYVAVFFFNKTFFYVSLFQNKIIKM